MKIGLVIMYTEYDTPVPFIAAPTPSKASLYATELNTWWEKMGQEMLNLHMADKTTAAEAWYSLVLGEGAVKPPAWLLDYVPTGLLQLVPVYTNSVPIRSIVPPFVYGWIELVPDPNG